MRMNSGESPPKFWPFYLALPVEKIHFVYNNNFSRPFLLSFLPILGSKGKDKQHNEEILLRKGEIYRNQFDHWQKTLTANH